MFLHTGPSRLSRPLPRFSHGSGSASEKPVIDVFVLSKPLDGSFDAVSALPEAAVITGEASIVADAAHRLEGAR
jgi:hypothetical protein